MQTCTTEGSLAERLPAGDALPALPATAARLRDLLQNDQVDAEDIARTISREPTLAEKILRTVNSSLYGVTHRVSTVSQAVVLLGLEPAKTLALGFCLAEKLREEPAFKVMNYWRRTMYSATA